MSETPTPLDALTRTVLAIRESCEAALLQLAVMRGAPAAVAPIAPAQPAAPPSAPPAPRAREVRVMGNDTPHVRGAMPHAPAPIPVTPLDGTTIRALTDVSPAAPNAPTANEAGSSDAPTAS